MSIFNTVKQFLSGQPMEFVWSSSSEAAIADLKQSFPTADGWEVTKGQLRHPQQKCNLTCYNNEVNGTCTGKIGELTGSAMVSLFNGLPAWLPSLYVRVTVRAEEGELTVSLREGNGTVVSVQAPGIVECNAELTNGRVWLRCESGPTNTRNMQYEVVII